MLFTDRHVSRRSFVPAFMLLTVMTALPNDASAQPVVGFPRTVPGGVYPSDQYYIALEVYRSGDLERAIDLFDVALARTRKDINGRWIDAIPVHAMLAECHWHAGNLPLCRANVDQVFQLAVRHRGWLRRINWETAIHNAVRSPPRGIWQEASAVRVLPTSKSVQFQSGEILTEQRLAQGGAVEQLNIQSMDVLEIMRGVAMAAYRRRVLLGALADQDPLATELLEATKYPQGLRAPLGKTLIGAMRATERFSAADDARTIADGNKYATLQNGVHPLTPLLLLCHTSAGAGTEQWKAMPAVARNCANAAGALGQYELIGEAMQLAAGTVTPGEAAAFASLAKSIATSTMRQSRLASLHCLIAAADAAVTAGDAAGAEELIQRAQALSARRDVAQPRLDAYGAYVNCRLAALQGKATGLKQPTAVDKGMASLTSFAFGRKVRGRGVVSMPRLYQLQIIINSVGNVAGPAGSEATLADYCRRVPVDVWRRDPVDALAACLADRRSAFEVWLRLATNDSDGRTFVRRLDSVLADRFLHRLKLGGRIAQVRHLATAKDKEIGEAGRAFLASSTPAMRNLQAMTGQPVPDVLEAAIRQSESQEALATQVALDRLEIPRVTPTPLPPFEITERLPEDAGLLTFTRLGNQWVATLTADDKSQLWAVGGASRLNADIGALLRDIGVSRNRGKRLPEKDDWKVRAEKLRERLIPDTLDVDIHSLSELVIVPDGPLWSLPFELLPTAEDEDQRLGDVTGVRYAPMPGLAFGSAGTASSRTVAIAAGSFFQPKDAEANEKMIESVLERLDDRVRLKPDGSLPASLLGDSVGVLAVAAARGVDPAKPLSFSIGGYDARMDRGGLDAWLRLPAAAPRTVVLAGFRTPVAGGQIGSGDDLFFVVTGLRAAGVQEVFISRWPVGGQSTATILKELLPEIPFAGLPAAWTRGRAVLRKSELDPSAEPLVTSAEHDRAGVTGDMPLFWSGYLVVTPVAWADK